MNKIKLWRTQKYSIEEFVIINWRIGDIKFIIDILLKNYNTHERFTQAQDMTLSSRQSSSHHVRLSGCVWFCAIECSFFLGPQISLKNQIVMKLKTQIVMKTQKVKLWRPDKWCNAVLPAGSVYRTCSVFTEPLQNHTEQLQNHLHVFQMVL